MLSIKKTLRSFIPQLHIGTAPMKLSPVVSESDELIRAIEDDVIRHDDNWTLDSLDTEQLEQDWQHIVHDIRQDPNWSDLDNTE